MAHNKYYPVSIFLHWLTAVVVVSTGLLGFSAVNIISGKPLLMKVFYVHKTMGLSVLIITIIRLMVRISYEMNPAKITALEKMLSRAGHILMYILLMAIPISGYAISNAHGHDVSFFSIALPRIVPSSKYTASLFEKIHSVLAFTLFVTIVLHVTMAIKHLLIDKINLFARMW
ncbi:MULTISPECIES: cytochrome b [Candidatus Ichthyocystis]|uniref:cytochrome b n=1 Tax=Candidatus Ichthyocystis TaxID=2929841 RepID=UPI000B805293|nr:MULTISPECIES: cytochrome b/b6 domain-containing protein [Ichthyocystis]